MQELSNIIKRVKKTSMRNNKKIIITKFEITTEMKASRKTKIFSIDMGNTLTVQLFLFEKNA